MLQGWRLTEILLGGAILAVAAFMLLGQEDQSLSNAASAPLTAEEVPLPPSDLPIKHVDARTKACMADVECMQAFFLKVTLGNDYEPRPSDNPVINKWQGPIRFKVYGADQLDEERDRALTEGLKDIIKIAATVGLDIRPDRRGINVIVLLTADLATDLEGRFSDLADKAFRPIPGYVDDLLALWRRSKVCAGLLSSEDDGRASYVGMYISPALDPDLTQRCVYEEFSQMLGLYADVADKIDSLYTDQKHRRQLTEFDFLLLRLLYHPLIEPGMTQEEVINVFPDVYDQVIKTTVEIYSKEDADLLEN